MGRVGSQVKGQEKEGKGREGKVSLSSSVQYKEGGRAKRNE